MFLYTNKGQLKNFITPIVWDILDKMCLMQTTSLDPGSGIILYTALSLTWIFLNFPLLVCKQLKGNLGHVTLGKAPRSQPIDWEWVQEEGPISTLPLHIYCGTVPGSSVGYKPPARNA